MNSRDFERAKEMGRACRRNGGKRTACPYKIGTATELYDAWLLGWAEEDAARKVRR